MHGVCVLLPLLVASFFYVTYSISTTVNPSAPPPLIPFSAEKNKTGDFAPGDNIFTKKKAPP